MTVGANCVRLRLYKYNSSVKWKWTLKKDIIIDVFFNVGVDLFSQEAALQLFSARVSLTTVFGMGTGGPSA